jgi:thymidylate synthase ThyX
MTESHYLQEAKTRDAMFINGIRPNNLEIGDKHGYEAKIICDSVNKYGSRLTTITATYPRFVHSELMTHRTFSRNAASSRAIPISKVIEQVVHNPAAPYKWQVNIKGMQGGDSLPALDLLHAKDEWMFARDNAVESVQRLQILGAHKQICNRLLEPFVWMTTVISATNWRNFFHLRCNDLADPTIRHIAEMIKFVVENNDPEFLDNGEWHLPFVHNSMDINKLISNYSSEYCKKISAARCARVSYLNHDKIHDPEGDLKLFASLVENGHWSALEHVASPTYWFNTTYNATQKQCGNFHESWIQYRKTFKNEVVL